MLYINIFLLNFRVITLIVSALSVWAILLNMYGYKEKLFLIFAAFGMAILSNPLNILSSDSSNIIPVILMGVALAWIIIGKILLNDVKASLPLAVGSFLFNFSTMLFIPLFIIISFSVSTESVSYGVFELVYFIISGVITWLGIHFFIQTMRIDKANRLELLWYTSIVYTWIYQLVYYFLTQSENGDSTDSSPILENLDPSIEQSVPTDSTTPDAFGIWEYIVH